MDKALIKYISIGVITLVLFFVNRNNKEKQSLDDYYIENISSDPPTLNPHICDDNVSWRVVTDIFEGLVCYNQKNEIELSISNGDKIYKDRLQGKKIVRIPLLGYLVMFLQSIAGAIILILGIILSFVWYKTKTNELES